MSNNNDNNGYIVTLELTSQLVEEQTVERFDFNAELNQGFLKLNGIHGEIPPITFPITFQYDEIKREDIEYLRQELNKIEIESSDITAILEVLYLDCNKEKIIHSIREYNIQKLVQRQQQAEDYEDETVSSTIRRHEGKVRTRGTITGISKVIVMISKLDMYCNDGCNNTTTIEFPFPVHDMGKGVKKKCEHCDASISKGDFNPEFRNAVIVELEDTETYNEMDRLEVYLFDEHTENILVNETVEITGEVHVISDGKKRHTCLYADSVKYVNRNNIALSDEDIEKIQEFAKKHGNNTVDELVEIYDYSIVGYNHAKKGSLFIAANTSNKIEKSEHLDGLLTGPPGLAKTEMLERATEVVPGSSMESAEKSSGKTITAIVDKTDSNTVLRLGAIPIARSAICGLDEIGKMSFEDQGHLLGVMQKRFFTINKHGIRAKIASPTSIIASANPMHGADWRYDDKIDLNEFPILRQLTDRFDLIFIFRRRRSKEDDDKFIDKLDEVKNKIDKEELPDETEFLIKYIQYAKRFNPILTDGATIMIREFYKQIDLKDFGSPRVLDTLRKLTKAVARLKLKDLADEDDATEAMEFYNVMLLNFQKQVVVSESLKDVAYKECIAVLQDIKEIGGITLEDLVETICKRNEQLAVYFGYDKEKSLKMKDNKKVRNLFDLLLNHTNIKKVQDHPIVLQWWMVTPPDDDSSRRDDLGDPGDPTFSKNNNNEQTIEGVQFGKDGPIHLISTKYEGHEGHEGHQI